MRHASNRDWDEEGDDEDVDWDEVADDDDDEPTIPCPYCGADIHEESLRCPRCERYISDEDSPAAPKPWWIVIGAALGLYAAYRWILG